MADVSDAVQRENGTVADGRQALEALVDAVRAADLDRVAALYRDDAILRSPLGGEVVGRDAIRAAEGGLFDAFSEIEVDAGPVLQAGATFAVEIVLRATHTGPLDLGEGEPLDPTGTRVEIDAVWCIDVDEDARIVEERDYMDAAAFMAQLGLA